MLSIFWAASREKDADTMFIVGVVILGMLKWPDFRNPAEFGDVLTVILVYVTVIIVFSEVFTRDVLQTLILASSIVILGWVIWAVHNILERHVNDEKETD